MLEIKDLVLASANKGKIKELQDMLGGLGINIIPQRQLGIEDAEETGLTFVENAILKARHAAEISGLPAIADDSGLEVDYLKGAPGIYSARFSGVGATDQSNLDKLMLEMQDAPADQRSARYQTVIAVMTHGSDPTPILCQGTWEGEIAFEEKGSEGFGYDPVFKPIDADCHAAELEKSIKNAISHRGKAISKLLEKLRHHSL
ncbi:RdgB/HAM1 family non-canonical purine NTP pyrophosphatase [Porticoccaceae bacterium]|jgi:XTP/dITP diphosphohydrolase|nr:RdgB/HAM1 family non-canonical purine NTP pyrophosphatase [Porticoccaceae bacterium]MDA9569554.1 RdgB/HAM1 family non-canonical purine NTP pyrophosphatase [Porticoccaceae bacterium]